MTPEQNPVKTTNTQPTASNPQTGSPSTGLTSPVSGGIQRGTANEVLTSSDGIALTNNGVAGLSLSANTSSTMGVAPATTQGPNPVLVGFSTLLFVAAAVIFIYIWRSENNTTK